jgi:hypothetical protein
LLTKTMHDREAAGQQRILHVCKEHESQMESLNSAIESHRQQVDVLERCLHVEPNYVA